MRKKEIGALICGVVIGGVLLSAYISRTESQKSLNSGVVAGLCGQERCNVILIVSDTLSAENMSVYGYERDTTPYLNTLAEKNALVFENAMASASWTPPSMIALFFSRPSNSMSLQEVFNAEENFVKVVKEAGIESTGFLKQLNMKEFYKMSDSEGAPFVSHVVTNNFKKAGAQMYPTNYYTDDGKGFVDALGWIKERKSRDPYFMMIHDVTVHDPYNAPAKFQGLFTQEDEGGPYLFEFPSPTSTLPLSKDEGALARLAYDQEVRYLDAQIEEFITGIGNLDDTVVILTSDHGEIFGEIDGHGQHGRPTEARLAYAHNQVTHIPLIIFGGGIEGATNTCPVSHFDIAPTILSLLSVNVPSTYQGKSVLTSSCAHEMVYSEQSIMPREVMPILLDVASVDERALSSYSFFLRDSSTMLTARDERFKVVEDGEGVLHVFDLQHDKKEERNLAGELERLSQQERERIEALRTYIKKIREESYE